MDTTLEAPPKPQQAPTDEALARHAFEVFYDGDCPLCLREVAMLRRMDKRDRILFTDIAAQEFAAADYGKAQATLMAEIHGRLPDGRWVIGAEVFRHLYSLVGFGWAVAPTRLPGVRHAIDVAYKFFARYRLPLTGRKCDDGPCQVETEPRP